MLPIISISGKRGAVAFGSEKTLKEIKESIQPTPVETLNAEIQQLIGFADAPNPEVAFATMLKDLQFADITSVVDKLESTNDYNSRINALLIGVPSFKLIVSNYETARHGKDQAQKAMAYHRVLSLYLIIIDIPLLNARSKPS